MKIALCMSALAVLALPLRAQFPSGGLQDGGHGSGGDEKAEYTTSVNPGWNIVSVPIVVGDYLATGIFPTATSPAFAYQGGYVQKDTLENGPGYWLKFGSGQVLPMNGTLLNTDSIPVAPGWNIVGSVSNAVAAASIIRIGTTVQSSYFGFDNGYQASATIEPGAGYWVKVSTAGTLVLSSTGLPVPPQKSHDEFLSSLNSVMITDASGGHQQLYFVSGPEEPPDRYELPPPPPAGIFDARFASQSMVAFGNTGILISSGAYPVDVRWNIVVPGDYAVVVDGKETPMSTSGSLRLVQPPSRITLRVGAATDLPKEFSLSQNYPNPFNPTTTLRYSVPVAASVTMTIFNVYGQEVRTLVNGVQEPGYRSVEWDALNGAGSAVASGVYFYRLQAIPTEGAGVSSFSQTRKMVLLR